MTRTLALVALVAGAGLASGCVTTRDVPLGTGASAATVDEIARLSDRYPARIRLVGEPFAAGGFRAVRLDGDSLRWQRDGVSGAGALSEVCEVRFLDRTRGVSNGVRNALLAALGTGALVALTAAVDDQSFLDPEDLVLPGVLIGGLIALPIGVGMGASEGYQTFYRIQPCNR